MQKYGLILLGLSFLLLSVHAGESKASWPKEISNKAKKYIYGKIAKTLKKYQKDRKPISIQLTDQSHFLGDVVSVKSSGFYLKSSGVVHKIAYRRLKAKYIDQFTPQKDHHLQFFIGVLYFYSGSETQGKSLLEKAASQGNDKAQTFLEKIERGEIAPKDENGIEIVGGEPLPERTPAEEDSQPAKNFRRVYPKNTNPPKGTRYPCAFTPLPKTMDGIPPYHHPFLDQFCGLVVKATHARLKVEMDLHNARQKRKNDYSAAKRYEKTIDALIPKFAKLNPPHTLKDLPSMVTEAITLQKEIYAHALRGGDLDRPKHKKSSSTLRHLWSILERRFPQMTPAVKKSLFHHFCALDISGSVRVFDKK